MVNEVLLEMLHSFLELIVFFFSHVCLIYLQETAG